MSSRTYADLIHDLAETGPHHLDTLDVAPLITDSDLQAWFLFRAAGGEAGEAMHDMIDHLSDRDITEIIGAIKVGWPPRMFAIIKAAFVATVAEAAAGDAFLERETEAERERQAEYEDRE